jgi:hypothetical protein
MAHYAIIGAAPQALFCAPVRIFKADPPFLKKYRP